MTPFGELICEFSTREILVCKLKHLQSMLVCTFAALFVTQGSLVEGGSHWIYLGTRYAPKKAVIHELNKEDGGLDYYNYEQLLNVLLVKEVQNTQQNT